jgi:hypothetical protein
MVITACASTFKRVDEHKDDRYFWPKTFEKSMDDASLTIYQPQVIDWARFEIIKARMALSYKSTPKANPIYGSVVLTANTDVDMPTKSIKLTNVRIDALKVSRLSTVERQDLQEEIQKMMPKDGLVISLDRATANYQRQAKSTQTSMLQVKPPKIFISKKPAVLMILDGKPIWSPIKDNALEFALNTNWDLFKDKATGFYYVRYGKAWFTTSDLQSPWHSVFQLPDAFFNLPKTDNWKAVKANLPKKYLSNVVVPNFFVIYEPAELISLTAKPILEPIGFALPLSWVTNTESDLFFLSSDNYFYYLVSGRWFRTQILSNNAKWEYITDRLPDDFKRIPASHSRGSVRASIPGTIEAETAVIMAQIPQKVQVNRGMAKPDVVYVGEPDFRAIESTELTYAINTSSDVIYFRDSYYLCQDGIWFVSSSAKGPWKVATKIPEEIYAMPASSPLYHTTFVYVYGSDVDTVTVGYTSGYSNVYVSHGVVVYGTGWYYPPYWYYGSYYYYPIYYNYPYSYGANTYYNPNTGTYGRAGWAYGPYGGVGAGSAYNPTTGVYTRATAAYGPAGAGGWVEAYNPRTNTSLVSRQGTDYYSAWGGSVVKRDNQWAATAHYNNEQGSVRGFKTSEGTKGFVGHDGNNLYAGKDGNVYRRNEDGWQKQENGSWNDVSGSVDREAIKSRTDSFKQKYPDAGSNRNLNTDRAARSERSNKVDHLNRQHRQRQYGTQRVQAQRSWQGGNRSQHNRPTGGSSRARGSRR